MLATDCKEMLVRMMHVGELRRRGPSADQLLL